MLCLSRRKNEEITIEIPGMPAIHIVIADITSSRAKVGIDAPKEFKILRSELTKSKPAPTIDMPLSGFVRVA